MGMENLFRKYLRWRHSKGFGVHSPYAFGFVEEVLNPRDYALYGYHDIDAAFFNEGSPGNISRKEIRLILRILVFLNTKRILTFTSAAKEFRVLEKILNIPFVNLDKETGLNISSCDLVMIDQSEYGPEPIIKALNCKASVLAIKPDKELKSLMEKPLNKGVLFAGNKHYLLVPDDRMEYVVYTLNF